MQHEAAQPKGNRAQGDQPTSQPMRATSQGEVRRNPSTDQKKVRRANQRKVATEVTATVLNTDAWRVNPGDHLRMPNGNTMKVHRVRQHETSAHHVYIDTDGGTTLAERTQSFQVVPHNSQQMSLPGYGTPGGNTNRLPGETNDLGGSNQAPSGQKTQCPSCQGVGTLSRQGDHYTCSKCGYRETFGGAGGNSFTDSPRQVQTPRANTSHRSSLSPYSTINTNGMSAIARRAQSVLTQEENS